MDLERVCDLFAEIDAFLKKYGDPSIRNQHLLIKDTIDLLRSAENNETKTELLIRSYKALFTGKGGLTEFYVWDNDYEKRMAMNEPFEHAADELWKIMKEYV